MCTYTERHYLNQKRSIGLYIIQSNVTLEYVHTKVSFLV